MRYLQIFLHFVYGLILGLAVLTGLFLFGDRFGIEPIRAYVILSGSMEPAIPTGSVVFVRRAPVYLPGDIITYAKDAGGKNMVTHRIAGIGDKEAYYDLSFITKGDANEDRDTGTVSSGAIAGRVFLTVPYIGRLAETAKTPKGFILLVIIPATIIVYEELKNIKKELFARLRQLFARFTGNDTLNKVKDVAPQIAGLAVVVPLSAAVFIVSARAVSFYHDTEVATGSAFRAAAVFATPTLTLPPGLTPTPTPTPPTGIAQYLVINEVLPDTSCTQGNTEAQWIEVYNGYPNAVNLKNFKITDGTNTIDLVTAASVSVPSGGFALLAHNSAIWNNCYSDNGVTTANLGGTLNIDTGTLQLLDAADTVIDTVIWGTAPLNPSQNQSIERDPDGQDSAFGVNFAAADFVVRATPLPGL